MDWQSQFESELTKAEQARGRGNEGRARVCARRAAGLVVQEYFSRRGIRAANRSAVELLNQLAVEPSLAPQLAAVVQHLVLRVDEDFKLPAGVDLIAETRELCSGLLPR